MTQSNELRVGTRMRTQHLVRIIQKLNTRVDHSIQRWQRCEHSGIRTATLQTFVSTVHSYNGSIFLHDRFNPKDGYHTEIALRAELFRASPPCFGSGGQIQSNTCFGPPAAPHTNSKGPRLGFPSALSPKPLKTIYPNC